MSSAELLDQVAQRLWVLVNEAARDLGKQADLEPDPDAPAQLQGRLLRPFGELPASNPLADLARRLLGDLRGGEVRLHGWQRAPGAETGAALFVTKDGGHAAFAATPGPPAVLDLVVTPETDFKAVASPGSWKATFRVISGAAWEASLSPGSAPSAAVGSMRIELERPTPLEINSPVGAGVSAASLAAALEVGPSPTAFTLDVKKFRADLLPEPLSALLGEKANGGTTESDFGIRADRAAGLRFDKGGLRLPLPARMQIPGLAAHGFAIELGTGTDGLALIAALGLKADLPGLPVHAQIDDLRVTVPFALAGPSLGPLPGKIDAPEPGGFGIELKLPLVSGGGAVRKTPSGGYAGVLDLDLGIFGVQAMGLVDLPREGKPTSVLALLSAYFPYPGIQLGFGFAIDAVGGLVGVNRRVDVEALRALVSDGNADRILFPENAVERAEEITRSLAAVFPSSPGRFVVGPMVRINWGGRIVTFSGAVVLDLPGPAQILILGRLLVAIPDPDAPLIQLQASVLGRIDPSVPETEILVSLAGSRIVAIPVSGELFLLVRGGDRAVFVLSAGGFHPDYVRPPGIPELDRLSMDLGGGFLRLRAEAYLAITSNALMFGAQLHLDATIAGCGVEGQLGLDALFVFEPVFSFSVRVNASVAVLALGRRLASVGLIFTLAGPAPWRASGVGRVKILWKTFSLNFDHSWGQIAPPQDAPPEVLDELLEALKDPRAWAVAPPPALRVGVHLSPGAKAALAEGEVVAADVTLRVSQRIVPLGEPIKRFARLRVPPQQWDIGVGEEAEGRPGLGDEVQEHFVAAEFFELTEDEQLTAPAFIERKSGVYLQESGVRTGTAHRVDDGYETAYKVEPEFLAIKPDVAVSLGFGSFALERFARVAAADEGERLALWRATQEALPRIGVGLK